jgi:uncharacterized membrane protein YozB (DUF420 family)
LNLILQAIIVVLLASAVYARLRHNRVIHATMMSSGIALHTVSIFAIMVPSLLSLQGLLSGLSTRLSMLVAAHAAVGSIVEILGVLLVAAWISNRTKVDNCFRRKHIMEATTVFWIFEVFLGVYLYMTLYPFV